MNILTVVLGAFLFVFLIATMMVYAYLSGETRIAEAEERWKREKSSGNERRQS